MPPPVASVSGPVWDTPVALRFTSWTLLRPARSVIRGLSIVPPGWLRSLPLTSIWYTPPRARLTRQYSPVSEPIIKPVRGVPPVVKVPALPGICITSKTWESPYMGRFSDELS